MHGYVVPSRIGTFACTTLQLEFSVYSGKKSCKKKYVKNQELINKDLKKKKELIWLYRSNSRIKSLQNYIITQIIVQKMMNLLYNCTVTAN